MPGVLVSQLISPTCVPFSYASIMNLRCEGETVVLGGVGGIVGMKFPSPGLQTCPGDRHILRVDEAVVALDPGGSR